MSSVLLEPISCAVCLCDFTDPQTLPCAHSFCKMCILGHMQACTTGTFCPECRQQFTKADLRPNPHLRDIKVHLKEETSTADRGHHDKAGFCMEHDEKLKLFCETDQSLVCVICRDGDKHKGHKFKPVIEIEKIKKEEVRTALEILTSEGKSLSDLVSEQRAEIQKSKKKADFLSAQISAQFEEMHQFLRQKEAELKKKLKMEERRNLQPMEERIAMIETLLREEEKKFYILKSALGIPQPEMFIQWWNDKGLHVMESVQTKARFLDEEDDTLLLQDTDFMVIPDSFSFSPYESHLQFFVWKEMLGSIKQGKVAECLTISQDTPLIVSPDGLSVRQADIQDEDVYKHDVVYAEETFITGQHYWEIEVGAKPDWSLGLEKRKENKSFLARLMSRKSYISKVQLQLTRDKGYIVKSNQSVIPVLTDIKEKPRRIGLFLDCDNNQVCFYNADNMSPIHTFTCSFRWPWSVCLKTGMNSLPLTVCCYRANDDAFAN